MAQVRTFFSNFHILVDIKTNKFHFVSHLTDKLKSNGQSDGQNTFENKTLKKINEKKKIK